jgi:radical SAM protein with 4Fe4S-binding SPASM domain
MGINGWRLQPIIPFGRVQEYPHLQLDENTYICLEEFIKKNWKTAGTFGLKLMQSDGLGYFQEYETEEGPWQGCSAGISTCSITSDGKIKGCLALTDDFIEGDLRKKDFWDIWFDPKSFSYTRKFQRELLGDNCSICDKSDQCHGGCSAKSYSYTSRLHNDPFCIYKHGQKDQS